MAAPAVSWCLSLLIFLLSLDIPQVSTEVNETSKLTCFYDSKANISCVWSQDGGLQNTPCQICAQSYIRRLFCFESSKNVSCELSSVGPASWACNLLFGPPNSQKLTSVDTINISVTCLEGRKWKMVMTQDFTPFNNLRLMAPDSLQVTHIGTDRCNITWNVSQSSHYIERSLEFEARTRSSGHTWEEAPLLILRQNQQWIYLENLHPNTPYELQVRVRPQQDKPATWSPWSQALAFKTRPAAWGKNLAYPSLDHIMVGLGGAFGFIFLVYLLANCRYLGPWLKKILKCHIPDPSEFFSKLSSEHGGDFQDPGYKATGPTALSMGPGSECECKWLSSPFPSSAFSPSGPAPEISPLEVLDRDAKAMQLLLLQQDKEPSLSLETSGHSLTSCFTNQGYFFFHLPDALEIESCQVYFTYDPCTEEPEEGGPGAPEGSLLPPLPPPPGEEHAYCTLPPGEDLLLFSPSVLIGPSPPNTALRGTAANEERLTPSLQEGVPRDWASLPLGPSTPGAPDLVDFQSPLKDALGEAGEEVPAPGPREGASFPWARPPGQGQVRAPTSCPTLNTDAYLSLQELQERDPAHSV